MVLSVPQAPASVLHTSIAHVSKPSSSNSHTHTQYVIRVSDERTPGFNWTVYRRYSEFRLFKVRLEDAVKDGDMCAHCSIMSKRTCFMQFPHRRLFWNTKEKVLESRRVGLNAFLDAVAKHARTCRESMTCKTRQLMDQFLDVNDMRYTYLNVNMSDSEDEYRNKLFLNSASSATSSVSNSIFAATPAQYSSGGGVTHVSSCREVRSSSMDSALHAGASSNVQAADASTGIAAADAGVAAAEPNGKGSDETPVTGYPERLAYVGTSSGSAAPSFNDGRVLSSKKSSLPNLLEYGRASRSSRGSSHEDQAAANRAGRLSDWETTKYQTSYAGRHSDPGARNDLLSFASCSSSGRRSEHRNRSRRVHLSSAAKRVKKLEEQEARFSCRPPPRQKKIAVLAPIVEEEDGDDE